MLQPLEVDIINALSMLTAQRLATLCRPQGAEGWGMGDEVVEGMKVRCHVEALRVTLREELGSV